MMFGFDVCFDLDFLHITQRNNARAHPPGGGGERWAGAGAGVCGADH